MHLLSLSLRDLTPPLTPISVDRGFIYYDPLYYSGYLTLGVISIIVVTVLILKYRKRRNHG